MIERAAPHDGRQVRHPSIAVVGGGISGLGAAWRLAPHAQVTVFEQAPRLGGHADTATVDDGDRSFAVDTGFIVYNRRTYPLLDELFRELDVPTRPTQMSFSVRCDGCGLEFAGGTIAQLLRSIVRRPRAALLVAGILRLRRVGRRSLRDGVQPSLTLRAWAAREHLPEHAITHYLVPLTAAVWSTAPGTALDMPADTTLRFLANHGLLGGRPPRWRTVVGGSETYVRLLRAALERRGVTFREHTRIERVGRIDAVPGIELVDQHGERAWFDRVVVATHSVDALELLDDPTGLEQAVLAAVDYTPNEVLLHDDPSPLPTDPRLWASWNYHLADCAGADGPPRLTYHMNLLQHLPTDRPISVSVNPAAGTIDPDRIIRVRSYAHPRYDLDARTAQQRIGMLHMEGERRTGRVFCGAWQRWGFHEDGLWSGYRAADAVLRSTDVRLGRTSDARVAPEPERSRA